LQAAGVGGSGVEAILQAAERRPEAIDAALRSWLGLDVTEQTTAAVHALVEEHKKLRHIRAIMPEVEKNQLEMAQEEQDATAEQSATARRVRRKQGPTLEQLMGQTTSPEQMRQMAEGWGEAAAIMDEEDRQNALDYMDLVQRLNEQDERADRDKLRRQGKLAELTENLTSALEDNRIKQQDLQETGITLGFDENDILRERYRLLEEQYALEADIRRVEHDANEERIRKIKEQAKLQEEEEARRKEAQREFLATTAQAADIASMSTKLVLGETKEARAIESIIRAAQEGAEAISALATYDYWGFAQHTLAATLHASAAAKAGGGGGSGAAAGGGASGGAAAPARPTNERGGDQGRPGGSTTVIFQAPVSEAEMGRLMYRAQRAADRRYGRS
jgi:hypothetical protein